MENKDIQEMIEKHVRFVGKEYEIIDKDNPLRVLVETINCDLMADSVNYKISSYAIENLKEFFPCLDKNIESLVNHVFYRAYAKEIERKNFIMSMATEILNSLPHIREPIERKADGMCVPFYILYVALAIYAKENGESCDLKLLEERNNETIVLRDKTILESLESLPDFNKLKLNEIQENNKIADTIPFDNWKKLDLRAGRILNAEDIPNADKLYKLEVDVGEEKPRTLVAGIKKHYTKDELKGKMCIVFCNLEPRVMKGIKSEGMILAAVSEDESEIAMLMPDKDVKVGSRIR